MIMPILATNPPATTPPAALALADVLTRYLADPTCPAYLRVVAQAWLATITKED